MAKMVIEETTLPDGRIQRHYKMALDPGDLKFEMPPEHVLRAIGATDDGTQKSEQVEAPAGVEADGAAEQPAGDDAGAETS